MYLKGNDLFISYNNSKINPLTNINHDIVLPLETLALSLDLKNKLFEKLSLTTGLVKESNSFLLSKSSGAFEFENDNITNFYSVDLRKNLEGDLPDLNNIPKNNDIIFVWTGTSTGMTINNIDFIKSSHDGLVISDVTSAAFIEDLPWD